jgi:hypothetical protein
MSGLALKPGVTIWHDHGGEAEHGDASNAVKAEACR